MTNEAQMTNDTTRPNVGAMKERCALLWAFGFLSLPRHWTFGIKAFSFCRGSRVIRDQTPHVCDFPTSAALIAARTPSGLLSLPTTGWLLMYSVGVIVIPRDSPRA